MLSARERPSSKFLSSSLLLLPKSAILVAQSQTSLVSSSRPSSSLNSSPYLVATAAAAIASPFVSNSHANVIQPSKRRNSSVVGVVVVLRSAGLISSFAVKISTQKWQCLGQKY